MAETTVRRERLAPELRTEDLARRGPIETPTDDQISAPPYAIERLRSNRGLASHGDVLALQRLSGNRAVAGLLGGAAAVPLQRNPPPSTVMTPPTTPTPIPPAPVTTVTPPVTTPVVPPKPKGQVEASDTIANKSGGILDFANQNFVSTGTSGSGLGGFRDPDASTTATTNGGVASPMMSLATGAVGLGFNAKKHHEAREELSTATVGTAKHRAASRDVNTSGADVGQNVSNVSSAIASGTGGIMGAVGVASQTTAIAGSVGGGIAAPLAAFQMGRYIRKAEKARKRVNALETLMKDEGKPQEALAASDERVKTLTENLVELNADITHLGKFLRRARGQMAKDISTEIDKLTAEHALVAQEQVDAVQEQTKNRLIAAEMQRALDDASNEVTLNLHGGKAPVSLRMIQAYALKKNNRGWIKKAVAAAGAALGAAGGAAALTASIAIAAGAAAGASVLMATPIGWALAGAAAAVGIGLATYQAWKFFSKRWKQAEFNGLGQKRSTGSRILNTLAFWRKTGPSKREEYAGALYKMANAGSDTVQRQEARKTLLSLGLDFDALGMATDKKNAEKLIAAKLAS